MTFLVMAWEIPFGVIEQEDPRLPRQYLLLPLPPVALEPGDRTLLTKTAHTSDIRVEGL